MAPPTTRRRAGPAWLVLWRLFLSPLCLMLASASAPAVAQQPDVRISQYAHQAWRFGDAGLLGTPQGIAQTTDGYIWVSTQNGLFRFDGMQFEKWEPLPDESLQSSSLWYLYGARNGSLYISTDLGLSRITAGHVYNYPEGPRWPGPFVEDAEGGIWAGISGMQSKPDTICRVGEKAISCQGERDGFICGRGLSNLVDARGTIWIGSSQGICSWNPGAAPRLATVFTLTEQNRLMGITSLAQGADGTLWAGTRGGLLRYSDNKWLPFRGDGLDGQRLSVSSLLAGKNDSLWIGTTDDGLFRLKGSRLEHFSNAEGLSGANILSLLEDHEGSLWVVTSTGIDHFRDYSVLSFGMAQGYFDNRARAIAVDRSGTIFFGSSTLSALRGDELQRITDNRGDLIKDVQLLFTDSQDQIWVGTRDRLLALKKQRDSYHVRGTVRLDGESVVDLTEDRKHQLWASVENVKSRAASLLRLSDWRIAARYRATDIVGGQVMNALAPHPKEGIWVGGAAHGLFWFHAGLFERLAPEVLDDRIESLMTEPSGALWSVTPHGFVRYFDGVARRLSAADGLPCDSGVSIQRDRQGYTWFYLHCGIMQISDTDLEHWWTNPDNGVKGRIFGPLDGARPNLSDSNPVEALDGRLWSASDYEYQVIDPEHLPFNPIAPPVSVQRLTVDGRAYSATPDRQLLPHTQQIQIDYAGPSFIAPESVHFKYRLDGHDTDWIEAGMRRQAFYNDLGPGHYVFHVTACNNDGVWNERGAQIAFTILPAWYQTLLFKAAMAFLLVLLLSFSYLYRLRSFATSLKTRFDERLEERTRMARDLHDTLLQTIQGSKMVADEAREHIDNPDMTARSLDRLSDWLDRASIEGRAALEALRSSSLESDDLIGALRQAAAESASESGIRVTLATSGMTRQLHPIARDEVYRIGYEAIRNACKHSAGTDLRISLTYGRKLGLDITDNGIGIEIDVLGDGKPGHFGMVGMRERADRLGGQLTIDSSARGTAISLKVPARAIYKSLPARVLPTMAKMLRVLSLK